MGMNTLFDRDYRALNQSELIYKVTNRREFSKQENMTFEEVLLSNYTRDARTKSRKRY